MIDQRTLDFLAAIGENNSKEWMDGHRQQYRDAKDDVTAFAAEVVDQISAFDPAIRANPPRPERCVTRLNRDMRFGRGKGPYKSDYYIVVGLQGIQGLAASYAVHIEPGNCFAGGGAPNPRGPDLLMYRSKVSERWDQFNDIVTGSAFQAQFPNGIQCQSGVRLKRVPRGFAPDDPAAHTIKLEGFITREHLPDDVMTDPRGLDQVIALLRGSKPLVDLLNS